MLRKVTFSGMVPFFQVYLLIAIDNIHGNKKRYVESSVNRLHKNLHLTLYRTKGKFYITSITFTEIYYCPSHFSFFGVPRNFSVSPLHLPNFFGFVTAQ